MWFEGLLGEKASDFFLGGSINWLQSSPRRYVYHVTMLLRKSFGMCLPYSSTACFSPCQGTPPLPTQALFYAPTCLQGCPLSHPLQPAELGRSSGPRLFRSYYWGGMQSTSPRRALSPHLPLPSLPPSLSTLGRKESAQTLGWPGLSSFSSNSPRPLQPSRAEDNLYSFLRQKAVDFSFHGNDLGLKPQTGGSNKE